jgi:hypothetical protein
MCIKLRIFEDNPEKPRVNPYRFAGLITNNGYAF